ncbi:MAG: hypothetical protein Q8N17_03105 [Burkholderiaceae bacterium]|nr:hypothetical protein [Burkholderiaceae bacterium]
MIFEGNLQVVCGALLDKVRAEILLMNGTKGFGNYLPPDGRESFDTVTSQRRQTPIAQWAPDWDMPVRDLVTATGDDFRLRYNRLMSPPSRPPGSMAVSGLMAAPQYGDPDFPAFAKQFGGVFDSPTLGTVIIPPPDFKNRPDGRLPGRTAGLSLLAETPSRPNAGARASGEWGFNADKHANSVLRSFCP